MPVIVGVVFRPQQPPEDLRSVVQFADAAGVPELWLWEDCFREGGLTAATAALAWSQSVRVGVGLLPVPLRNPALLAMEIATLARLWPDRFLPSLGHGVLDWMAQVGASVASPMTLLREYAEAVRDLLDGGQVDVAGRYVRLDRVALDWPPSRRPPLLVGARGERTIRLAGEVADGVLLDSVTDPASVRRARELVEEGRAAAGRPGSAVVELYLEIDPGQQPGPLARLVADRVGALGDAGADAVVLHGTDDRPDPRPLVDALAAAGLLGPVG
jgi:alkanesulfonate monooxygenase SsuD/methylene tetrahydromethanopterin reductase-like flavin-dependent oxidoreductase (luciferase family)